MEFYSNLKSKMRNFLLLTKRYSLQQSRYRYSLVDVLWDDKENTIELSAAVNGIKKNIVNFFPEKILYDDELLSEFSPCDVRAITYLSFRKYIRYEKNSMIILGQLFRNGETVFSIKNLKNDQIIQIEAKKLYQNHDYLSCLNKDDMVNVISTAVQEQTMRDFKKMEDL